MKLLLDTCVLLWGLQEPKRLSAPARQALRNPENLLAVSTLSFWEIGLKCGLGKLTLDGAQPEDLPGFVVDAGWKIVPLSPETAASAGRLPAVPPHRDPFDRLLVWTAIREDFTLVSRDGLMRIYAPHGLKICW